MTKIAHSLRNFFDFISNERLKKNLLNAFPFWIGAILTGIVAVLYAKIFAYAEYAINQIIKISDYALFIISPCCFFIAWWVVVKYSPYAKGSGIPQVSAAIDLANPRSNHKVNLLLSIRVSIIKIISSILMVFGGAVVGREGPTIQIGASIFKKINDYLPSWYPKIAKRNMIVTGAAAGLAAAFNTPLGGIVFAIEELTKTHFNYFKSPLLTGVIIAGLTAVSFWGPYLYLGYPELMNITPKILFTAIPVALTTGISGSLLGIFLIYLFKLKHSYLSNSSKAIYTILCGLIIAFMIVYIDTNVIGSGKEIMVKTLFTSEKQIHWYFPILKILGVIVSFSTGAAGGIFAPSLSIGASIGAVIANLFQLGNSETNLIILCGMTGFLTSMTRSPFTSSILVLEMTNSHNVIFYILTTALISNLFATLISRKSFYEQLKEQYIEDIEKLN